MNQTNIINRASLILRIGLAFAFVYAAIKGFVDPNSWIGFFPEFMRSMAPSEALLLNGWGAFEILMALWLLSGRWQFWAGVVSAAVLAPLILFNLALMDVIFRDVSILLMAVAVAVLGKEGQAFTAGEGKSQT